MYKIDSDCSSIFVHFINGIYTPMGVYYNHTEGAQKEENKMTDVVLFNDLGCEIARETITADRTEDMIIADWTIYPGDKIELIDTWHEI